MEKEMEKEGNINIIIYYLLKVNIITVKNGVEKVMIQMGILYMN